MRKLLFLLLLTLTSSAYASVLYSWDDGTAESAEAFPGGAFWMNHFTVAPYGDRIISISVAFGLPGCGPSCGSNGHPVSIYLWSDPNQDGNPSDAKVLASTVGVMSSVNTDTFATYDIGPVDLTGTSFFAGAGYSDAALINVMAIDDTASPFESWISNSGDPNALTGGSFFGTFESQGYGSGTWMIRATGVPEPSAWTLAAAGLAALAFLGRRRA